VGQFVDGGVAVPRQDAKLFEMACHEVTTRSAIRSAARARRNSERLNRGCLRLLIERPFPVSREVSPGKVERSDESPVEMLSVGRQSAGEALAKRPGVL
jgi:hypothetical protein